jgi:hypothetical protein
MMDTFIALVVVVFFLSSCTPAMSERDIEAQKNQAVLDQCRAMGHQTPVIFSTSGGYLVRGCG